jgi:hypothetical protein
MTLGEEKFLMIEGEGWLAGRGAVLRSCSKGYGSLVIIKIYYI